MNPRIKKTSTYLTSDGEKHTYRSAAELHQARLDLKEALEHELEHEGHWDLDDVLVILLDNLSVVEQFVNDAKAAREAANNVEQ